MSGHFETEDGITISQLSEATGIPQTTIHALIQRNHIQTQIELGPSRRWQHLLSQVTADTVKMAQSCLSTRGFQLPTAIKLTEAREQIQSAAGELFNVLSDIAQNPGNPEAHEQLEAANATALGLMRDLGVIDEKDLTTWNLTLNGEYPSGVSRQESLESLAQKRVGMMAIGILVLAIVAFSESSLPPQDSTPQT